MESITTFYRINRDPLYKKGFAEAEKRSEIREQRALQRNKRKFAERLLMGTDFSLEKIASLTDLEVAEVKKVKARLDKKKADAN